MLVVEGTLNTTHHCEKTGKIENFVFIWSWPVADPGFARGGPTPGGANLLFDHFFPKAARKWRNFGPGGGESLTHPHPPIHRWLQPCDTITMYALQFASEFCGVNVGRDQAELLLWVFIKDQKDFLLTCFDNNRSYFWSVSCYEEKLTRYC